MPTYSTSRLTKRSVEAAPAPTTGDEFLWDSEVSGFGVRIRASGRRVFVFKYREPETRTTKRLTLGSFPAVTVEGAREVAKAKAGDLAKGVNPKRQKVDIRATTLDVLFPIYLAERVGKISESTHREYRRTWEKTLAKVFGRKPVAAIDESTVAKWHSSLATTPYAANRALNLLSAFFSWAERRGHRLRHTNPCVEVERYEEERRSRSLTRDEYQTLGATFRKAAEVGLRTPPNTQRNSPNTAKHKHRPKGWDAPRPADPAVLAALRFLVLSGWREKEALTLKWSSVNLDRGVAVLADTKTKRSERPLGSAALDVLRSMPRMEGNPYVFPGHREGQPVRDPKKTWESVKYAAKLDAERPLRLHDLRHSFATVARDELGWHDHIIARLIGHKVNGMTSRYGEVRDTTAQTAADAISQTITNWLDQTSAKVLPTLTTTHAEARP
jgi:integrase